jgi:hypothetical protein
VKSTCQREDQARGQRSFPDRGHANPDIEGEIDITSGGIVPTAEIASIVADPKVRAFAVVNLEQLEHRVQASLGVA